MENIILSVILPVLNGAGYIRECLDSISGQTMQELEILCVDAGSTDKTLEIIKEYIEYDHRIRLLHSPKKSYGLQVNIGIREAHGEYIGIVESDDYIDKDMYQNLYKKAFENRVDFVKGGFVQFCNVGSRRIFCKNRKYDSRMEQVIDLKQNPRFCMFDTVHIWSGIYRKDFLISNEIFLNETEGASYQDTSFSILVGLLAETCVYTGDCYYYYRIDNENSSVKSKKKVRCIVNEYEYLYCKLDKVSELSDDLKRNLEICKLGSYFWNFKRLSGEARQEFLRYIKEEMETLDVKNLLEDHRQRWNILSGKKEALVAYEAEERACEVQTQKLMDIICAKENIVLVSAGKLGRVFGDYCEAFGKKDIACVCDNNPTLQRKNWKGYSVKSIEEAVQAENECLYVIVNKYYSESLKSQLLNLGVPENKICVFIRMPSFVDCINQYKYMINCDSL